MKLLVVAAVCLALFYVFNTYRIYVPAYILYFSLTYMVESQLFEHMWSNGFLVQVAVKLIKEPFETSQNCKLLFLASNLLIYFIKSAENHSFLKNHLAELLLDSARNQLCKLCQMHPYYYRIYCKHCVQQRCVQACYCRYPLLMHISHSHSFLFHF